MKTIIDTKVATINLIKKELKAVELEQLKVYNNRDYDKCEDKMIELKKRLRCAAKDLIFSIDIQLDTEK